MIFVLDIFQKVNKQKREILKKDDKNKKQNKKTSQNNKQFIKNIAALGHAILKWIM